MSRPLTEEERVHVQKGLVPHCSECHEPVDIVDASALKQPGDVVILPHGESPTVCPLSTVEWLPQIGRTWKLWAYRYESGKLWHIGERKWVELHGLDHPLVPVLVEEILSDPYADSVTHYGWQYVEGSRYRHGDAPTMIQVRTGNDPKDPKRSMMFLSMCFPYGLDAAIAKGDGNVVAMRITEGQKDA